MQLTRVSTSRRVAPGLLTARAWRAIGEADLVLTSDAATAEALTAEGVPCRLVQDPAAEAQGLDGPDGDVVVVLLVDVDDVDDVEPGEHAELVRGSHDLPGARLLDLVTVMDRLRRECPWDREQTHLSLASYLVEETYETLEAIESGDPAHLREELGDLLLQVFFHARLAEEREGGFDVDDVARGIADKLVYRHPHVFAGLEVGDADEVDRNWERLKAQEKQRSSPVEGVPLALPALAYAEKIVGRLSKAGVDAGRSGDEDPDDLGERLLDLVREARAAGIDPEQELRVAVRRLIARSGA